VRDIEDQIDALYRLPLAEFTAARAALSRSLGKDDAARVKGLKKPSTIPWLVNQLYWRARPIYQQLKNAGQALRAAQIAALERRPADIRQATDAHRRAITAAIRRSVALAAEVGLRSTTEPLAGMFEAVSLASAPPEHPGRFTEVIHPAAFEALAGISPDPHVTARHRAASPRSQPTATARAERDGRATAQRERAAEAERILAEEARAARRRIDDELKKADRVLAAARDREADARSALERAEADVRSAEATVATLNARRAALSG